MQFEEAKMRKNSPQADWVSAAQTEAELEALRKSVDRCTPYGSEGWMPRIANAFALEATLHPRADLEKK